MSPFLLQREVDAGSAGFHGLSAPDTPQVPVNEVSESPLSIITSLIVSCTVNVRVTGSDSSKSSSTTVKVMIWIPGEREDDVVDAAESPKLPFMLECQRYPVISPFMSFRPVNVTGAPVSAGLGEMDSIVATGNTLPGR